MDRSTNVDDRRPRFRIVAARRSIAPANEGRAAAKRRSPRSRRSTATDRPRTPKVAFQLTE